MRRIALAAAVAVASLGALAGSATAATGSLCGAVNVTINGQPVVDEAQCQALPELPAPPALPGR